LHVIENYQNVSLENLKLNKQLLTAMQDLGYTQALPLQTTVIPRILGGQQILCVGHEDSGKTTALVLGVIMRLKYAVEIAPRALILAPDKEHVTALVQRFEELSKNTDLRILGVFAGVGLEGHRETIEEGVDIIIGTPDRVLALYLKSGLNLNRLQQFILDDAELIVKQGLQSAVHQITLSLPKCQKIVFTVVMHEKMERLTTFLDFPVMIEIEPELDTKVVTIPQVVYQVPNYKTKQNLLNLMLSDAKEYPKVIVFVNTKLTARNLYKSIERRLSGEVALLKPPTYEEQGYKTVEEFKKAKKSRILVVANEIEQFIDLNGIPFLFHFDLPADIELYINRIDENHYTKNSGALAITFATDIELIIVKKIEHATGQKMEVVPLPAGLIIEGSRKKKPKKEDETGAEKSADPNQGAFHEKKASNAKDYNLGWKEKEKLYGKKYSSKKYKGYSG